MEIELRERNESDSDEEDFFLSLTSSWDDDEDDEEEDWNKTTNASYSTMPSLAMNPSERTKTLRPSAPSLLPPIVRRQSATDFCNFTSSQHSGDETIDYGNSPFTLGNNLTISIQACNHTISHGFNENRANKDHADEICNKEYFPPTMVSLNMPIMPLITPPSSPRRIQIIVSFTLNSGDTIMNIMEEEAAICEWPCNLTVDNAITAALELLDLPGIT